MPVFPRIVSPCPYKGPLSDIVDGDVCRLCERQVFDLTHMDDGELAAFLKGCSGQTCVTYRIPQRAVFAAAAALATAALPVSIVVAEQGILPTGPGLASEGLAWPPSPVSPPRNIDQGELVLTGDIALIPDSNSDERAAARSSERVRRVV